MKTITTAQAMRYSRQIMLSGFDLDKQELLINSSVLLIGVGGLGCAASQYLVAGGIGKITIVDDDIVESTNLQRQVLHYESSIGDKKVDSAAQTLRNINHFVEVLPIDHRLGPDELCQAIQQHDIVLDCSDNLATRNELNKHCYAQKTPLVSGAAIRMEGQVFCVIPQRKSACYACISHFFGEQSLSCTEAGVISPLVGIVGAMQALEAIKILTQYGTTPVNTLQFFDAMTCTWTNITVEPLANCACCSKS